MAGQSYTALTLTTTLPEGQAAAFYDSRFLQFRKEKIELLKYAQMRPLPKHTGKTIDFFRYHPLTIVTSNHTEGSQSVTAEKIKGMNVTASLVQMVKLVDWSEIEEITHRDPEFRASVSGMLGENNARSMDWNLMKEVSKWGIYAIRADWNATYEADVTCATGTVTAGYDQLVSAGLTQTHHIHASDIAEKDTGFWSGAWVTCTDGNNYGECRRATYFNLTTDGLLFSGNTRFTAGTADSAYDAWGKAASDDTGGMTIHICTPYNLKNSAVTDSIVDGTGGGTSSVYCNVSALLRAGSVLAENEAERFDDGKWKTIISWMQYQKLFKDTDWKTMNTYTPRDGIITGKIGELAGMDIITTSQAYRENASTHLPSTDPKTSVTTGIDVVLCFGKNAFGAVDIAGVGGPKDPKIGFKDTQSDAADPTGQTQHAYWKAWYAMRPLNANWCVGVLCKSVK